MNGRQVRCILHPALKFRFIRHASAGDENSRLADGIIYTKTRYPVEPLVNTMKKLCAVGRLLGRGGCFTNCMLHHDGDP
jgi:hypothetical protein